MKIVATYASGRNRSDRDRSGTNLHAVPISDGMLTGLGSGGSWDKALCGYKPGARGNGWSSFVGNAVTCPRCAAKIAKMQDKGETVDRLTLEEVQDAERAARERVIDGVRSSRAIWD